MTPKVDERTIDEAQVRLEHRGSVNVPGHWAYLLGVLIGGTILMIALIALISSGS